MAGIRTIISGELAQSKTKGKAFVEELNRKLSPEAICKKKCETEVKKKK